MRFDQAADRVWEQHFQHTKAASPVRSILLEAQELIGHLDLQEVTRETLRGYVGALRTGGNKESSIRRKLGVVMKVLRELWKDGDLDRVPAPPSLPPPEQGRMRILTPEEELRMTDGLRAITQWRIADMVTVLVNTGLRLSEALRLTWGDTWLSEGQGYVEVAVSKNGRPRRVPVNLTAYGALQRLKYKGGTGPFKGLKSRHVHRAWAKVRESMGLAPDPEFVPHALRHTFASRLAQKGVSLHIIKELLGHRDLKSTLIYAHLSPEQFRHAVNKLED